MTIYDYDARGLVISRKDARNVQTTYAYDNAGRLTAVTYPATPALNVTYTYDGSAAGPNGIGHVTHLVDAGGTTDYTFDAAGRVGSEKRTFGTTPYTTTYGWDSAGSGKLTTLTLPSGLVLTYAYDALGRPNILYGAYGTLVPQTPIVGNITDFPFGALQQIGFYNGLARYQSDDLEYKPNGLFLTKGSTTLTQRYFSFGDHLNLTEINNDSVDPTQTQDFNYDDAQRLTYATGNYGSRFWQYDTVGNRLSESKTVSGATTTSAYAYPTGSNRLSGVTQGTTATRAFTYDAAGNILQDTRGSTAYNFTINDAGRIAQLKTGTTLNANYAYDARDRLSQRQTLAMSPAGTTQYLYDIWDHLLSETDGAGHIQRDYLWLGDEPAAVIDWTVNPGAPTLYYVHTDHLHRPEMMTDTSGTVVWKATYEPFGTVSTVTGAVTQTQRFPGQYFQLEAGLAYNWHRHYDSTTGRYTTADPLGVRAGPSLYGYAGLNPVTRTDRRGLDNPHLGPYGCWAAAGSCGGGGGGGGGGADCPSGAAGGGGGGDGGGGSAGGGGGAGGVGGANGGGSDGNDKVAQLFPPILEPPPVLPDPVFPEVTPRGMTPLDELPAGSSGGPGAGKNFPKDLGRPTTPENYPLCMYCGEQTNPENFHRDHIIPKVQGGDNSPENLGPSCASCNLSKGPKTPAEWYQWLNTQRGA